MATILIDTNEGGSRDLSVTDTNNNGLVKPVKLQNPPASFSLAHFLSNKMIANNPLQIFSYKSLN